MALKVLVVDDSALMRKHLHSLLTQAGFAVSFARNGQEAVEQVLAVAPDVVTLDINMPEMDGLTALSLIMAAKPTPVVMVSSLTTQGAMATLEALAMGAIDFVAKPGGTISLSITAVAEELVQKVKTASRARVGPRARVSRPVERLRQERSAQPAPAPRAPRAPGVGGTDFGLILIGVSTGGPRTLEEILPALPADLPWPVLVVQHMPPSFTATFAARLDQLCALRVKELDRLEQIEPGNVYIARGGTDMVVAERMGKLVALSKPESPKHLWHPSVDVLVESAMVHVNPERLLAIQLTGMGYDGAEAMAALKKQGGRTIAESEETAVVFGMPKELIDRGGATLVLPANKVAAQIQRWLQ
jgi:two-component system chemotaxis response regulator CheB